MLLRLQDPIPQVYVVPRFYGYDAPVKPKLSYNGPVYDKGLFNLGDKYLYVSPGLGNFPLPLRLFNHPELTVIKLVSSTQGN